jgi:hypothetical protein
VNKSITATIRFMAVSFASRILVGRVCDSNKTRFGRVGRAAARQAFYHPAARFAPVFLPAGKERKGARGEQGKFIDFWKTSLPWRVQFDEISGRG